MHPLRRHAARGIAQEKGIRMSERPALNYSTAHRLLTQSPAHAWHHHPVLNPDYVSEESDTMDAGAIAHAILLGKGRKVVTLEFADWRTKAAKEARANARADGCIPILAHKLPPINGMVATAQAALLDFSEVRIDLSQGVAEQSLFWDEGGAYCRATPDWRANDFQIVLDVKTTAGSAEPNAWIRSQMLPMGYDLQAAFQLRANEKNGGPIPERTQFLFMVIENYEPYACSFVGLSPALYEIAERKREYATTLWRNCIETGRWSGYPQRVAYAEPSAWQIAEDEERAANVIPV